MNIIEKLKDKTYVRAFGLMTPEEQETLEKVELENLICLRGQFNKIIWENITSKPSDCPALTYAIKPGYQPEPEYVDLEIVLSGCFLGAWTSKIKPASYSFTRLHCLPSLPNFERFYYHADFGKTPSVGLVQVAAKMDQKHIVYARFRNAGD